MEMDFEVFAREDFDPKAWINSQFHSAEQVELHAASAVGRLQLSMQGANRLLDEATRQVGGEV